MKESWRKPLRLVFGAKLHATTPLSFEVSALKGVQRWHGLYLCACFFSLFVGLRSVCVVHVCRNPKPLPPYGSTTFSTRSRTLCCATPPHTYFAGQPIRRADFVLLASTCRGRCHLLPLRTRVSSPAATAFSLAVRRRQTRGLVAQRPWCAV